MKRSQLFPLPLLLGASIALTGCVTETEAPVRGMPVKGSSAAKASIGSGPVATPASRARSTVSKVQVAVVPLGSIEYDGLTLPLVSPDGLFVVSRIGPPPTWPAMLAMPGASSPPAGQFRVYSIAKTLDAVAPTSEVPEGCLLGRDCDSQGFLIERMNADGSRSIGKVQWITGEVSWLVESADVNAHAVFFGGGLLFVRRSIDASAASLVMLTPQGETIERIATGGTYAMPLRSDDPTVAWVLRGSPAGTEIESIRLGPSGFGKTLSRTLLTSSSQPAAAFQLATSVGASATSAEPGSVPPIAILSTKVNGIVAIDIATGRAALLSKEAIAVTPVATDDVRGYICTRDDGLLYVPEDAAMLPNAPRTDARLLNDPYIVRATSNPSAPFVLFGPKLNAPDRMELLKMAIVSNPD